MNTRLRKALKEAYALAPAEPILLDTLELTADSSESFEPRFSVRSDKPQQCQLETRKTVQFQPVPFRFTLPAAGADGQQELHIGIDNVDPQISDFISCLQSHFTPIWVVYRPYLSNDLTRPQMYPPLKLSLQHLTITDVEVTGRATFMELLNKKFPSETYTRTRFPFLGE